MKRIVFNAEAQEMTIDRIIVHGSVFHADDVFCVALMKLFNPDIEVLREFKVTDEMVTDSTIVADVGMVCDFEQRFDHHCLDGQSEEETAVCSVELLWRYLGNEELTSFTSLFKEISMHDCGIKFNEISLMIKDMNPSWDQDPSPKYFEEAVKLASKILNRKLELHESKVLAESYYIEAPVDNGAKVFSRFIPWQDYAVEEGIERAIFPSRDGFALAVRQGCELLPENWLEEKPEGCTFVHKGRFIAAFDTPENALKANASIPPTISEDNEE